MRKFPQNFGQFQQTLDLLLFSKQSMTLRLVSRMRMMYEHNYYITALF